MALDGGFGHRRSEEQLAALEPERVFVSGRQEPGSRLNGEEGARRDSESARRFRPHV
ncbi:MAG: hypothetical protein AB7V58_00715 [Solirubrobacterales bacterium]